MLLLNPWITHWALALVKGNREPHEAKKKSFDLGGNRTHDLRIRSTVTHHLKSSLTFSVRPCSSVGRVTVDLIRRSWVRFPPRSKDFFFASCGSLFPFTRANAQWVIHGFKSSTLIYTSELILWFHYLCSQCYAAQHSFVPIISKGFCSTRIITCFRAPWARRYGWSRVRSVWLPMHRSCWFSLRNICYLPAGRSV